MSGRLWVDATRTTASSRVAISAATGSQSSLYELDGAATEGASTTATSMSVSSRD